MLAISDFALDTLAVRPWPDQVLDVNGLDPRSFYVERFWLPVLGPSVVLLLRLLAADLERMPAGFDLPVEDTARALGLGARGGRNSPFVRTVNRCCQFRHAHMGADGSFLVRRRLPTLSRSQVQRLPQPLQDRHREWDDDRVRPDATRLRNRARHLALTLFELGEAAEEAERQLIRWSYPPALAREATGWAGDRHSRAVAVCADDIAGRSNVTESGHFVTSNP
jgi:hypothetical protein